MSVYFHGVEASLCYRSGDSKLDVEGRKPGKSENEVLQKIEHFYETA